MKINKNTIISYVSRHLLLCISLLYGIINIFFARVFWGELLHDNSLTGSVFGEILATEWNMEKVYQNIIHMRNPFAGTLDMLYPFGSNFISTDSGNGFLFVFLRPFLSPHQSFFILSALALVFANIGMYLLLKKLGVRSSIAFIIGLVFGYMTFIQPRIGHLTYVYYYPFPWFYFCLLFVLQGASRVKKVVATIGAAFFFILTLYLNLYFFVSLAFSAALLGVFYLVTNMQLVIKKMLENILYIVVFSISCLVLLFPWLQIFIETARFEELPRTTGWGGAIEFSSDIFGYFIPSIYSYFFGDVASYIGRHAQFAYGIFENFSYPGIIILFGFAVLILLLIRKRITQQLRARIAPFLFVSISFWILTLGPFLHVLGRWGLVVEENIRIVIPLPYILFHYLPFMANIRSPGRLVTIWIFFSYIVVALLLNHWLKDKSRRFVRNVLVILVSIFIIDHYFLIPTAAPNPLPLKLYALIQKNSQPVSVMELPFVVRDGFMYFGDNGALDFITGQQYHGKSVIGGYMGRVPHFKREYYVRNPLLGYFGRLVDLDIKNNGSLDRSPQALKPWQTLDVEQGKKIVDFLDLSYILVRQDIPSVATAEAAITQLGFVPAAKESRYELWYRKPTPREFLSVKPGTPGDEMYLGAGWNTPDPGFRWVGKKTSVMFKITKSKPQTLSFTAASYFRARKVHVYLNKQFITTFELAPSETTKNISVDGITHPGINTVHFLFDSYDVPAVVETTGSTDMREIAARFYHIALH
ncbi:hypothetical protein KAZ66_01850 [Candidatus Woesebacteria bacterium]|nr:hypothetical protein [Candidatus Woesebacteria bacterium]